MISYLDNLRELWIEAPLAPKSSSLNPTDLPLPTVVLPVVTTDLRKEMVGELPSKLRKITIGGKGFNQIADNIFSGLKSRSLHLTLFNTSISRIPDLLFQRLGNVQNVSLDLRYNNYGLSSIPNPNSARHPFMAEKVFLTNMKISGNTLSCDCGIG